MEQQKESSLSTIRHELKTPLAALRGTLQLTQRRMKRVIASEDQLSPEMSKFFAGLKESLDEAVRQVDEQTRLINELLGEPLDHR